MESSVKETLECKDHNENMEFLCLDPDCELNVKSCMICIKENHCDCKDDLIIEKERLKEILVEDSQNKIDELQKMRRDVFAENLKYYDEKCDSIKKSFESILAKDINLETVDNDTLTILKNIFKIKENADGNLALTPIIIKDDKNYDLAKKEYEGKINSLVSEYIEKIKNLKIDFRMNFEASKFIKHPYIKISETSNGLLFGRNPENAEFNYFSCIYPEEFKKLTKISIKIVETYKSDAFLDMGFLKKSKFSSIDKNKPIVSFGSNSYSYCGTSQTGLKGTYTGGFKPGLIVFLEYDPVSKNVKITRSDGNVNLSNKISEDCYFYLTLYHKEAKCLVKKSN